MENKDLVLAQWQTCVEMANSVSQRRDTLNNLFVTLNMSILTAISIVSNMTSVDTKSIVVSFVGFFVCIVWMVILSNFRILNCKKFEIINDLETRLPEQPFNREWKLLKQNTEYIDSTLLERSIPIIFILAYTILIYTLIPNC